MRTHSWSWEGFWRDTRQPRGVILVATGLLLIWWTRSQALDLRVAWTVWGIAGTWHFQHLWPGMAALMGVSWTVHRAGAFSLAPWAVVVDLLLLAGVFGWVNTVRRKWDQSQRLRRIDPLTNLLNRMGTIERLEQEIARANRRDEPLVLIFIDCDNFKQVNDSAGHAAGDQLLWEFGLVLKQNIREYDVAGRLGGDEFLLVLPHSSAEDGFSIARRVFAGLKSLEAHTRLAVTLSAGVVAFRSPIPTADVCLKAADEAMYHAKGAGKDGLHVSLFPQGTAIEPPAASAGAL